MAFEHSFEKIITDLWKSLGLETPRFGAEKRIFLSVDAKEYVLQESGDGMHLVIEGEIGRLSEDVRKRAEQVTQLLKFNLALLTKNGVCVCLKNQDSVRPLVVAQHIYPYAAQRMPRLVSMIEEVVARVEAMSSQLEERSGRASNRREPVLSVAEELSAVIFRP